MADEFLSKSDADSALADERRVRVRHTQSLSTYAQRGSGDLDQVWWIGSVRNISGSGIGMVLKTRFETGTVLTLELENASRDASHTIHAKIVRVFPDRSGWYLGCTFLSRLAKRTFKHSSGSTDWQSSNAEFAISLR